MIKKPTCGHPAAERLKNQRDRQKSEQWAESVSSETDFAFPTLMGVEGDGMLILVVLKENNSTCNSTLREHLSRMRAEYRYFLDKKNKEFATSRLSLKKILHDALKQKESDPRRKAGDAGRNEEQSNK